MSILLRFAALLSGKYRCVLMKMHGAKIGKNINYITRYIPQANECKLLSIGNFTTISGKVVFIFHDGAIGPAINRHPYFEAKGVHVNKYGAITVGDHVFIGYGCIVLPGVSLSDYSIIAAGSVVTKSIPCGQVSGGVPARYICNTSEYISKVLSSNGIDTISRLEVESIISTSQWAK